MPTNLRPVPSGPTTSGAHGGDLEEPPEPAASSSEPQGGVDARRLTGELRDLLAGHPIFRTRHRGYDRVQVGNYVRWVEDELSAARLALDQLADRYGRCLAANDGLRQQLSEQPDDRSWRKLADHIEAITTQAAHEADELRRRAESEARAIRELAEKVLTDAKARAVALQRDSEAACRQRAEDQQSRLDALAARAAAARARAEQDAAVRLRENERILSGLRAQQRVVLEQLRKLDNSLGGLIEGMGEGHSEPDTPPTAAGLPAADPVAETPPVPGPSVPGQPVNGRVTVQPVGSPVQKI